MRILDLELTKLPELPEYGIGPEPDTEVFRYSSIYALVVALGYGLTKLGSKGPIEIIGVLMVCMAFPGAMWWSGLFRRLLLRWGTRQYAQ
jgi:hypothetical protein